VACLTIEGFDELADDANTGLAELSALGFSTNAGNAADLIVTNPRFADGHSPRYLSLATNQALIFAIASLATAYQGTAIRLAAGNASHHIMAFRDGTSIQCDLRTDASGHLIVTRNGTQIGATGATVLAQDTWYYLEWRLTIHNSTGSFEVRLNGVTEITGSGLDTQNTANAFATQLYWHSPAVSGTIGFDDIYVDSAAFAGPIRIWTGIPNGNGNSSDLVGSDGNSTDNYLLVDDTMTEGFANGDTDYVQSDVVGDHDTYAFPSMPTVPSSIYAVDSRLAARADDAGARGIRHVVRSGGADNEGTTRALTSSYVYYSDLREVDPATAAAWTEAGVNAMEMGMKVQS
jgi:hypothetical protein